MRHSGRFLRTLALLAFLITIQPIIVAAQTQFSKLLADPLPAHAKAQGQPAFYKPDTLYQYIDGGADVYLLYDFQTLLHQEFKSGAADLTADIYDMGKPEDAFGIYSSERSPNYTYIPAGAEGYRSKGMLNFFQDRYYVKLSGTGTGADALLDQFARTLSTRISGTHTMPSLLTKLPAPNRIRHSEQYIRKDPLGHAFLAPAYVVSYGPGAKPSKLLISVANDPAGAKFRLDQLGKHFKLTGESAAAPDLGTNAIRGKNSFEGSALARTQGRYLLILWNPSQNGAALLKSAAAALQ